MATQRQVRVAENESMFRDVNERVEQSHERLRATGPQEFLCECGDAACADRVSLTLDEYERLRSNPRRFAVIPGHEIAEVAHVVARTERFAIVEKIGAGGQIAEQRDPRMSQ